MIGSENTNQYIPGVCNIGKEEIKGRKKSVYFALALLVVVVLLIELLHANHLWRLIIFIPVASFAVSFQQVYFKFCVNFGMRGVFNFGDIGKTFTSDQKEYYRKDRAKALKMIIVGVLIGIAAAVIYYFI